MGDKTRGLYDKFRVERVDGSHAPGGKHDGCQYFVLDITHDPHAVPALLAYADSCGVDGYTDLAGDLRKLAVEHCDHRWTDTLHGPDTVGEHCEICGVDRDYDDSDLYEPIV